MKGNLFLVTGPSGAGKDTLLDLARPHVSETHIFPQRYITRPASAGGEQHIEVSEFEFNRLRADGQMCVTWQAHELHYGIPASIFAQLASGKCVVINVSRDTIRQFEALYPATYTLFITAPADVLRARLEGRGREKNLETRIARASIPATARQLITINNGGRVIKAAERLTNALREPLQHIDSSAVNQ